MRFCSPSRMTSARGLEKSRSASSARSVFSLLKNRDHHDDKDRRSENERFPQVAESQVDNAGDDEQRKHRLARNAKASAEDIPRRRSDSREISRATFIVD
jgi:hypothetical protein